MHANTNLHTFDVAVLCDRKSSATVHQLAIYRAINQFKSKQLSEQNTLKIVRATHQKLLIQLHCWHSSSGTGPGTGSGVRYLFALFYLFIIIFALCFLLHAHSTLSFTPFPLCV